VSFDKLEDILQKKVLKILGKGFPRCHHMGNIIAIEK
jgi:hypothetical protein